MNKLTSADNRAKKVAFISSFFCLLLVCTRVAYCGELSYLFLIWNLFLAWIPLLLVNYLKRIPIIQIWKRVVLVVLWLIFLPNAPYILTDLFHLREQENSPFWFDWLLLISFGWTGLLVGFMALQYMEYELRQVLRNKGRLGRIVHDLFVPLMMILCAYGVYLGRYQRTNSWEVVTNPFGVMKDILGSTQNLSAWGISILFGTFLLLVWHGIQVLAQTKQEEDKNEDQFKSIS